MPTRSDLTTNKVDVGSLTIVTHDTGPHVSVSSQNKKITAARPPDPTTNKGNACSLTIVANDTGPRVSVCRQTVRKLLKISHLCLQ
jgi:hypothetical protein